VRETNGQPVAGAALSIRWARGLHRQRWKFPSPVQKVEAGPAGGSDCGLSDWSMVGSVVSDCGDSGRGCGCAGSSHLNFCENRANSRDKVASSGPAIDAGLKNGTARGACPSMMVKILVNATVSPEIARAIRTIQTASANVAPCGKSTLPFRGLPLRLLPSERNPLIFFLRFSGMRVARISASSEVIGRERRS